MVMSKHTGGPAFPQINECVQNGIERGFSGMTLRDYFAAQAITGCMTEYWNSDSYSDPMWTDIAKQAYGIADAMLKARNA